ncbi:protein of unknown function [Legionella longbeachae NSW150]|uniref:Uncharacterized protein n=1 Tax=Legionella longbeachae serogroup 1 (strain NSW150) TaxID=661367 RepID=D3HLH4_LEGLN|nr:hypothetical protein LLB_2458 [Legionella longbeachae D-4968]CBJ13294.1 protein of unknown function [Legionella longbeachae NSW150]
MSYLYTKLITQNYENSKKAMKNYWYVASTRFIIIGFCNPKKTIKIQSLALMLRIELFF